VVAVAAFAVFVAGMATAAGFGDRVVTVAPYVGAAVGAAVLVWALYRLRPWRVVRPVARGVRAAVVGGARGTVVAGRASVRATRAGARGTGGATRRTSRVAVAAGTVARDWLWRPREPWRPPAVVGRSVLRVRVAAAGAIVGSEPARRRADEFWCELEAAATERALVVAWRAYQRVAGVSLRR